MGLVESGRGWSLVCDGYHFPPQVPLVCHHRVSAQIRAPLQAGHAVKVSELLWGSMADGVTPPPPPPQAYGVQ